MKPDKFSTPLSQYHIDPQSGTAFTVRRGQTIRIIDVEGEQVSDLICFAQENIEEYLSCGRTTDYNGKIYFSTGDVLYSDRSAPMLKITADQVGKHIFMYAPCSPEMFQMTYNVTEPHPNCLDNLASNLEPFGIRPSQIHTAFNVFMHVTISENGKISIHPARSKAGDYIDLRAEMDLVVGVTACSAGKCNNYQCTSIDVEVYAKI